MSNKQIKVNMLNWDNGQYITRVIDIRNLHIADTNAADGWEANVLVTDTAKQEIILSDWVANRACEQHAANLGLISWEIVD